MTLAGRTLGFEGDGSNRVTVRWRPRCTDRTETMTVRRVVNCSGPQTALDRTHEPLLLDLARQGLVAPDPMRLGLAVDAMARTIDASGRSDRPVFALGPLTRGTFWEITAVPDIRVQTWSLARRLSNAHWVSGDGL